MRPNSVLPVGSSLGELFEGQVRRTPDVPALTFRDETLTYRQLNERANQLTHALLSRGVPREAVVALYLEPSIESVVALLAVLKAGAAYLALDAGHPVARIDSFMARAGAEFLITTSQLAARLTARPANVLRFDSDVDELSLGSVEDPPRRISGANLAYVLFTSGSTGEPKGVLVEHRNVIRLFNAISDFEIGATDVWSVFHSFAFDFSVWELWGPLLSGGRAVVVSRDVARAADSFADLLDREGVTVLSQTPTAFSALVNHADSLPAIRLVILGGEAVDLPSVRRWRRLNPASSVVNMYGITETTVHVTRQELTDQHLSAWDREGTPVGVPLFDLEVSVVDSDLRAVDDGEAGELLVGGAGVARGYLDDPRETAVRFLPDRQGGGRRYRSGDRGRVLPDGSLEYLGRIDQQVKIRGYRVDPTETEGVLRQHHAVAQGAVVPVFDQGRCQGLAAFVIPDREQAGAVGRLTQLQRDGELSAEQTYELPNGMIVAHANPGETVFLYEEIFERNCYLRRGISVSEGGCVFDVGANIGMFSVHLTTTVPDVTVYAFEPIPSTFDLLQMNLAIYAESAFAFKCGLGAVDGRQTFSFFPNDTIFSGAHANDEERAIVRTMIARDSTLPRLLLEELLDVRLRTERIECQIRTLHSVIAELDIERIDLLKLDVEKSELDVLLGLEESDWRIIDQISAEVHGSNRLKAISALLNSHGFQVANDIDTDLAGTNLWHVYAVRPRRRPRARSWECRTSTWLTAAALEADIRTWMAASLPDVMTPQSITFVHELPRTSTGKLDRRALIADGPSTSHTGLAAVVSPRTETEAVVCRVWEEILGIEAISLFQNVFDVGGHSLSATQAVLRIESQTGIKLRISDVFDHPTPAEMAALLESALSSSPAPQRSPALQPQRDEVRAVASPEERQMVVLDVVAPASRRAYLVPLAWRLEGDVDVARLSRAIRDVVRSHAAFQSAFDITSGEVWKRLAVGEEEFTVQRLDLRGMTSDQITERVIADFARPFDLGNPPLARIAIAEVGENDCLLVLVAHHVVLDDASVAIFEHQVELAYTGRLPSEVHRGLTVSSHRDLPQSAIDYWEAELAAWAGPFELGNPTAGEAPSFEGGRISVEISPDHVASLRAYARRSSTTTFAVCLAALVQIVQNRVDRADVIIGVSTAGRGNVDEAGAIGHYARLFPLRFETRSGGLDEMVRRAHDKTIGLLRHDEPSFDWFLRRFASSAPSGRRPLVQVALAYLPRDRQTLSLPGVRVLPVPLDLGAAKFELTLEIHDGRRFTIVAEYNRAVLDPATVEALLEDYVELLATDARIDSGGIHDPSAAGPKP